MNTRQLSFLMLLVFFAGLWVPLGQTNFLSAHWMKVGTFLAPILLFFGLLARENSQIPVLEDIRFITILFIVAYMLHQFEEHWIDALGRVYPFHDYLNKTLASVLGSDKYGIMTEEAIFIINTSAVWTTALLAIWAAPRMVFPTLAMAGIMFANAFFHSLAALSRMEYNPGLVTSIVLFFPLTVAFYRTMLRRKILGWGMIGASILWGLFGHVLLFSGLVAANVYGIIPVSFYYAALIALSFVPLLLFQKAGSTLRKEPE